MSNDNKTIAELYELDDDPWDRRSEAMKVRDRFKRQLSDAMERLETSTPEFIDPPADENRQISESVGKIYHRLDAPCKLTDLIAAEPSLSMVACVARNTISGCWVALNSQSIAQRVFDSLTAQGFIIALQIVDANGNATTSTLNLERREAIDRFLGGTKNECRDDPALYPPT